LHTDHFLEVFTPADDKAADGQVHVELIGNLTCECGLTAGSSGELNEHFLQAFRPGDAIGADRNAHALAG